MATSRSALAPTSADGGVIASARPVVGSSPRLGAYLGIGAAGLVASLLAGRVALAAFGAPLVLLAVGVVWLGRTPRQPLGTVSVAPAQALAGDDLHVLVPIAPSRGRIDVSLTVVGPVPGPNDGAGLPAWTAVPGDAAELRAVVPTTTWGRVTVTGATVRSYGLVGLVHWTWAVPVGRTVRVLPRPDAMRALLHPPPRAAAGGHPSTARGSGVDFAELRPLAPGDRVSDVNWRASARRSPPSPTLLVNVRHPERSGDVMLLLDTAADVAADGSEQAPWLPRAAQAAWAVAQAHLDRHDRVGLVTFGGYTSWISRGGGQRAAYALLDKLLAARPATTAARSLVWLPVRLLPPDTAIVAVTPLHSLPVTTSLVDLSRRGRRVAALVVDTSDLLPTASDLDVARRFWALEMAHRRETLTRAGIVTTTWAPGAPLEQAVTLLARVTARVAPAQRPLAIGRR